MDIYISFKANGCLAEMILALVEVDVNLKYVMGRNNLHPKMNTLRVLHYPFAVVQY